MNDVTAETYASVDAIPPDAASLMADASFQCGADWLRCLVDATLSPGAKPFFVLSREAGRPIALVPLQADRHAIRGLSAPYTTLYQPLTRPGTPDASLTWAGAALGRAISDFSVLRWDAMDADWTGLAPLLAGLRTAGYHAMRFPHFGNWHEPVAGRAWAAYAGARPGILRETIRRKLGRCDRDPNCEVVLACNPADVEAALPIFEGIYRSSWKCPEPHPAFGPAMVRAAAKAGLLRLGVLHHAGRPVAAQYWIVERGTATVLKLAHDESAKHLSPGTILTAWMIRHLIDDEHVASLDFGRGDDAYKQAWATQRRQRIGVLLADPRRPAGLAVLCRHQLGRAARRLVAMRS